MLGRDSRSDPVFMKTVATSCAGMSVHIERMTAISSTWLPRLGKTSLTSIPDLPFFSNLNGEAIPMPPSGRVFPSIRVNVGFGSQVSTCEGAPWAKTWITALALAGKCGARGASGFPAAAAAASTAWGAAPRSSAGLNIDARLSAPSPRPKRFRNWRRVAKRSSSRAECSFGFMRFGKVVSDWTAQKWQRFRRKMTNFVRLAIECSAP